MLFVLLLMRVQIYYH
ncbi:hypothetical protein SAMN04488140_1184 [Salinimicrobium catena]|nr:hypothetical protein SAMN04488140_1184 [Salinimicrobium catena]